MPRLKEKLKSKSGASLLLALLFFLVASTTAIIIVTAAVSTVRSIHDDKQRQQDDLALYSAAETLTAELKASSCTVKDLPDRDYELSYEHEGLIGQQLEAAVKYLDAVETVVQERSIEGPIEIIAEPSGIEGERPLKTAVLSFKLARTPDSDQYYLVKEGSLRLLNEDGSTNARELIMTGQIGISETTGAYSWFEEELDGEGNPLLDEEGKPKKREESATQTIISYSWQHVEFKAFERKEAES